MAARPLGGVGGRGMDVGVDQRRWHRGGWLGRRDQWRLLLLGRAGRAARDS